MKTDISNDNSSNSLANLRFACARDLSSCISLERARGTFTFSRYIAETIISITNANVEHFLPSQSAAPAAARNTKQKSCFNRNKRLQQEIAEIILVRDE